MAPLSAKLDDGEITTKEFIEANKKLEAEQRKLTGALERQTAANEAITEKWFADVGKFLERNPELNANQTRLQSFDAMVRRVTGDPENAALSNRKQLEKARDLWREEMGIPAQGKADAAQHLGRRHERQRRQQVPAPRRHAERREGPRVRGRPEQALRSRPAGLSEPPLSGSPI